MKKISIFLMIAIMVLGLTLTGCASLENKINETAEEEGLDKDAILDGLKDAAGIEEDEVEEEIDEDESESQEETDEDEEQEETDEDAESNVWGEIAKYEVESIIEEKTNSNAYILAYISKEETASLVDYFDEMLKDTEDYSCKKVTTIAAYFTGTIDGNSIIVAVEYDNFKDENRVEFTSYKK